MCQARIARMLGTSARLAQGACPQCRPCSPGPECARPARSVGASRPGTGCVGAAQCPGSPAADGRTISHEATSHVDPRAITKEGRGGCPSREHCPVVLRRPRSWAPGRSRPSPPRRAPALAGAGPARQPCFESLFAAARDDTVCTRGAASFARGRRIHDDGDENRSPPRAATRARRHRSPERPPSASRVVLERLFPCSQDGGIGRVPANTKTFGDAGHGGVVGDQRGQGPPQLVPSRPTRPNSSDQHGRRQGSDMSGPSSDRLCGSTNHRNAPTPRATPAPSPTSTPTTP